MLGPRQSETLRVEKPKLFLVTPTQKFIENGVKLALRVLTKGMKCVL
jgi:hypothetical protein